MDENVHEIRIVDGVTAERSGERLIVLDAAGSAMSTLSPTGAIVWESIEDGTSLDDLVAATSAVFPSVDPQRLNTDVRKFVQELVDLDLLSAEE